jgi:hypothetical protein
LENGIISGTLDQSFGPQPQIVFIIVDEKNRRPLVREARRRHWRSFAVVHREIVEWVACSQREN